MSIASALRAWRRARQIRLAAEEAEREFYSTAPAEWLAALAPLGTDAVKPYLESALWLIVVFDEKYGVGDEGRPTGTAT